MPHTHKSKWLSGSFSGCVVLKLCLITSFYQLSKSAQSILQNPLTGFTKRHVHRPIPLTDFNINIVLHFYLSVSLSLVFLIYANFPLLKPFVLAFNFNLSMFVNVMWVASSFRIYKCTKPAEVRSGINSTDLCYSLHGEPAFGVLKG